MTKHLIISILLVALRISGQDIRGAYIHFASTAPLGVYTMSVTVFTDAALDINRPSIVLATGNGYFLTCPLSSSASANGINVKTYTLTHAYPGPGTYAVSYIDSSYVAGVKNLPNSQLQKIHVYAIIYSSLSNLPDASPEVTNYPLTYSISGNQLIYTPVCTDADVGDSLSYMWSNPAVTSTYYIPNGATLNPTTGVLSFSKDSAGLYDFAITIREWRKNVNGYYNLIGESRIEYVFDIPSTVGVPVSESNSSMKVFPNPANDKLYVETDDKIGIEKLSISNTLGQEFLCFLRPETKQEIDISTLPKGIYFLRMESKQGQSVFKVVKE